MKPDIGSFAPPGKKAETSGEKKAKKFPHEDLRRVGY
jgi:hypothetical protein